MVFTRQNESNPEYVEEFINFGKELIELKKLFKHGTWTPYLKEKYGKSYRNCYNAMYLAKKDIPVSDYSLGIDGLLRKFRDKRYKRVSLKPKKMTKEAKKVIKTFSKFRKNHNKEFVESFFIDICSRYMSNVRALVITGPDYIRHSSKLFNTIANEVYIAEIDPDIFRAILHVASTCPYFQQGKVKFINSPIEEVFVNKCKYIDLDLMATIKNIKDIISNHIRFQSITKGVKAISFTSSVRKDGGSNSRFKILKELIDTNFESDLIGFDGIQDGFGDGICMGGVKTGTGIHCSKHIPNFRDSGKILEMHLFNYADSGAMMTCLIVYK